MKKEERIPIFADRLEERNARKNGTYAAGELRRKDLYREEQVQERAKRIYRSIHLNGEANRTAEEGQNLKGRGRTDEKRKKYDFEKEEERERRQKRHCAFLAALALILVGTLAARSFLRKQERAVYGRSIGGFGISGKKELILVNKENRLPDDYEVELHWLTNGSCAVSETMYDALSAMLTAGSTDGRAFVVASGYRSMERQQQLLDEDIAAAMELEGLSWQEAYDQETRETMPPGYSEHGTGLAIDIVALDYQILDAGQEMTEENQWLRENCSRYGFILRYPKDKEGITDIDYEPWHFRFVGKEAAEEITRKGITLEEYLGK